MIPVSISNCVSSNPLAAQLESAIPNFSWRREQRGPLVTAISKKMMEYDFVGSMPVADKNCGFCGKSGITTEYWFRCSDKVLPTVTAKHGDEDYVFTLPSMLTTGSKCREFPRISQFVRDNLNNVFHGIRYDSSGKDGLIVLANAKLDMNYINANRQAFMGMMLHIPLNSITWAEREYLMDELCYNYKYFVFAKRKTLPKDMPAICPHSLYKDLCKWYPRDAYNYQSEDIVLGIPFFEIMRRGRII